MAKFVINPGPKTLKDLTPNLIEFRKVKIASVPVFENCVNYDLHTLAQLANLQQEIEKRTADEDIPAKTETFKALLAAVREKPADQQDPAIPLYAEGNIPTCTEYKDNDNLLYNHGPDFMPFFHTFLVPEYVTPKGAIIMCGGGDHGQSTVRYLTACKDWQAMGYQVFFALNRTNKNPWCGKEVGADIVRIVEHIRHNAKKYRVNKHNIAYAGFSNGGGTGEQTIQYYSGSKRIKDYFPDYVEDELDKEDQMFDVYISMYSARRGEFDWTDVNYPATFTGFGLTDEGYTRLIPWVSDLIAHDVKVEFHTFCNTPHGQAGQRFLDGEVKHPNFEYWNQLADYFVQDTFRELAGLESNGAYTGEE